MCEWGHLVYDLWKKQTNYYGIYFPTLPAIPIEKNNKLFELIQINNKAQSLL